MVYDRNAASHDPGTNSHLAIVDMIGEVRRLVDANGGRCSASIVYDHVFADGLETLPPAPSCPGVATPRGSAASYTMLSR